MNMNLHIHDEHEHKHEHKHERGNELEHDHAHFHVHVLIHIYFHAHGAWTYISPKATLLVDFEVFESMKELFAFKIVYLNNEAKLSLLNV